MEKTYYRNICLKARQDLSEKRRNKYSKKIFQYIQSSNDYLAAESIFLFVSTGEEVETTNWFHQIFLDGKKIFIPYTEKGKKEMYMTEIFSLKELITGPMGILQIKKEDLAQRQRQKVDLVLAPGLAFDNQGYRLGYGGGFYDRFLAKKKHAKAYGVGFAIQRLALIPHSSFDIPVNGFFSENGFETLPLVP